MRDSMHVRCLMLAMGWLFLASCGKKQPAIAGTLEPSTVSIRAYVGLTKQVPIHFTVGGQTVDPTELTFQSAPHPEFSLTPSPLKGSPMLSYSPLKVGPNQTSFSITYRGSTHHLDVLATAEAVPTCPMLASECEASVFDPDLDACAVRPTREGLTCNERSCVDKGSCRQGVCVDSPLNVGIPRCPRQLTPVRVAPAWTYSPQPPNHMFFYGVSDAEGNIYFHERDDYAFVSLDRNGQLRWRQPDAQSIYPWSDEFIVQMDGSRMFITAGSDHQILEVRRQSDGEILWQTRFYTGAKALPGQDVAWIWGTRIQPDRSQKEELYVVDSATGKELRRLDLTIHSGGGPLRLHPAIATADTVYAAVPDWYHPGKMLLAALSAGGGDLQWMVSTPDAAVPVAVEGSTLLLSGGRAVDLATQTLFSNPTIQQATRDRFLEALLLEPDGRGYAQHVFAVNQCHLSSVMPFDARRDAVPWQCFLGTSFGTARVLARTPSGSVVVITSQREVVNDIPLTRPWLQIFDSEGREKFSALLVAGPLDTQIRKRPVIHGSKVIFWQVDWQIPGERTWIVAYDIPELLSQ